MKCLASYLWQRAKNVQNVEVGQCMNKGRGTGIALPAVLQLLVAN